MTLTQNYGDYHFDATVGYNNIPANGRVIVQIFKGSTEIAGSRNISGGATQDPEATTSTTINLAASDTVKLSTLHDTGSSANLLTPTSFSGFMIGRTA